MISRSIEKAKILIVEDDPALLKGLMDVLVFNGFSVKGADEGISGLEIAKSESFDLIILDVMLPGMDGFSICREIRKGNSEQAIMMLTAKGTEDDVVTGLNSGADDYVKKPFSLRELMARVESLLRRSGTCHIDDILQFEDIRFDPIKLVASSAASEITLTRREMDIVYYLYKNRNIIVSKLDLLEKVWKYTVVDLETRTVDIHIQKLRKKLRKLSGDKQLIITVRGEGYRLVV